MKALDQAKKDAIKKVDIILNEVGLCEYSRVIDLMQDWKETLRKSKDTGDLNHASLYNFLDAIPEDLKRASSYNLLCRLESEK